MNLPAHIFTVSRRRWGTTCSKTLATTPTANTSYHCNDAPPGYSLSDEDCTKTTTKQPTRPTITGEFQSRCTHSVTPNFRTSHHCNNAPPGHTLSGANCTHTVSPTSRVVYDCDDAPAGYRLVGANCTHSVAPATTVTYDCDNAPAGYMLSDTDCVEVTTKQPTRPTVYTCPATYTPNEPTNPADPPTCTKSDIINATVTTTPASCPTVPAGEPYRLYEDRVAGTIRHTCERTLTTNALTTREYWCPSEYRLEKTFSGQDAEHICRLKQTTTPST